jgi:hypothetical protein
MIVADETIQEIDQALVHLSDSIRVASENRKPYLLDLVDELLDAKIEKARS